MFPVHTKKKLLNYLKKQDFSAFIDLKIKDYFNDMENKKKRISKFDYDLATDKECYLVTVKKKELYLPKSKCKQKLYMYFLIFCNVPTLVPVSF